MKVGNSWLYRVTEPDGTVRRVLRTISETKMVEGEVVFHYSVIDPDDQHDFGGYDQLIRDGAIYVSFDYEQVLMKIVPLSPKLGESWESKATKYKDTYKIVSLDETVETPAGTFNCVAVLNEITDQKGTHKATFYFAPGVGVVRTAYDDGTDERLLKATQNLTSIEPANEEPVKPKVEKQSQQQKIDLSNIDPNDYEEFLETGDLPKTFSFNGVDYVMVGYAKGVGGHRRLSMVPLMYSAGERDKRLVVEYATPEDKVYLKTIREQERIGGKWLDHGLRENQLFDGGKDRYTTKNGEMNGVSRIWYPNGQLKFEREYVNGSLHGRGKAWHENGKPMYDLEFVNDKSISGKSWDRDGNELETTFSGTE
tara:strand:+ start:48834 stop:49934 length:1101 start_codon:yes stop_codon:yes gene_type:complete